MNNVLICDIISVISSIVSVYYYYRSTKISLPEPPHKGNYIKAEPFEKLFGSLLEISKLNRKGVIFLTLSILFQILSIILKNI